MIENQLSTLSQNTEAIKTNVCSKLTKEENINNQLCEKENL